jgi:FkbM family methyltransferase
MNVTPGYLVANWRLKLQTLSRARQRVVNWREAVSLRLSSAGEQVRVLRLRDGTQIACRGGNLDWAAFSNLVLLDGCAAGLEYLKNCAGTPLVLDLGANIGLYSVLAARAHPQSTVVAYEPAPPNVRMFEINRLLNPSMTERIRVVPEAVGGTTRKCQFTYDEQQPEASGLEHRRGIPYPVIVRAFGEIVNGLSQPITLAKIDIEGAEFELIEHTAKEVWERVQAISIELHSDDDKKNGALLDRMKSFAYRIEPECESRRACFLRR